MRLRFTGEASEQVRWFVNTFKLVCDNLRKISCHTCIFKYKRNIETKIWTSEFNKPLKLSVI